MAEVTFSSKDHGQTTFVGRSNDFVIANTASWLNNGNYSTVSQNIDAIAEREKGVTGRYSSHNSIATALYGQTCRVESVLLSGTNTKSLMIASRNDGIGTNCRSHHPSEL
jgi:hypothetical protein